MNYELLVDPPVSNDYLTKYIDLIFKPNLVNSSVSLLSGQGFGILSVCRYILRNLTHFSEFSKNRIYISCDVGIVTNEDGFVRDCLTNVLASIKSLNILTSHEVDVLTDMLSKQKLGVSDLGLFIRHITEQKGMFITVVMENFGSLYVEHKTKEINLLASLLKIFPMKTSYIFLSSHEFNDNLLTCLQGFASYFNQNIIWGKELVFDRDCANNLFANNSKWANESLEEVFIKHSSELAYGDPTVLKHIALLAIRDKDFAKSLLKLKSVKAQFNLIGEDFLNSRYKRLLNTLLPKTQSEILKGEFVKNDFVNKTGIFNNDKPLNPLFEEYLSRIKSTASNEIPNNLGLRDTLVKKLTVKELAMFELLESSMGSIVTREALSAVLWGESWHDYYSDWALNKQISNLRKKMREIGYSKELKVLKTEGFILV